MIKWLLSLFRSTLKEDAMHVWCKHAILREGRRKKVYKDSLGKPTVGIGHLVLPEDNLFIGQTITDKQIHEFFMKDSQKALKTSLKQNEKLCSTSPEFLAALISVNFQLGDWSKVFYTTYPLLVQGEYKKCIRNLKRSKWNKQTPVRVQDFINAIEKEYT